MTTVDMMKSPPEIASPRYSAAFALAGRLLIAPIFLLSGVGKITASATYLAYIGSTGIPYPVVALWLAILLEVVGGLALIVGYGTRLVGGTLAVFCLTTAAVFHNDLADQNQFLHFWKNLAMAGGLLQLAAFGAGPMSLDNRRT